MAIVVSDPLASFDAARWALEGTSDFWALVVRLSTIAIGIGVFIEVGATIIEILEDRASGKKLPFHAIMTLLGGAIVAAALGFEFWAEFKTASTETALRKNNAAVQGELDKRAREATAQAVDIARKFGGLNILVTQKEREMDDAVQRLTGRTDHAVSALTKTEKTLAKAQGDAIGSASKAATAADAANKTSASMTDTLNSERQMEARMRDALTPRAIDDAHFAALVAALKPFPKTPVEIALTRDPNCSDLLERISDAMIAADWTIQPYSGGGFGLTLSSRPTLPNLGEVTACGVQINISESDREKFSKPILALASNLNSAGVQAFPVAFTDKTPDGKPNPLAVKSGVIHLIIGIKP